MHFCLVNLEYMTLPTRTVYRLSEDSNSQACDINQNKSTIKLTLVGMPFFISFIIILGSNNALQEYK